MRKSQATVKHALFLILIGKTNIAQVSLPQYF